MLFNIYGNESTIHTTEKSGVDRQELLIANYKDKIEQLNQEIHRLKSICYKRCGRYPDDCKNYDYDEDSY